MDRVSLLLPKVLGKRGLQAQAHASLVVYQTQEWLEQALPQFARDLQAVRFADSSLVIAASHSIAAQECQQILPLLKEYLVKDCGQRTVEGIQLIRAN